MATGRAMTKKVTCEDCFFRRNLCARWSWKRLVRRSARTVPRGCGRLSSCASRSGRSGARAPPGPSPAPRSRRHSTHSAGPGPIYIAPRARDGPRQEPGLRGRWWRLQRLPRPGGRVDDAHGHRQRRLRQAARRGGLHDGRRRRRLPHARRPLPRPRAVRLRAPLRAGRPRAGGARSASWSPPVAATSSAASSARGAARSSSRRPSSSRSTRAAPSSTLGDVRIRSHDVPHFLPHTNALELSTPGSGGGRLTYGADHGPTEGLVEFAQDTDLLMVEATLKAPEEHGPRGHITAREAGEHGAQGRCAAPRRDPRLGPHRPGLGPDRGGGRLRRPGHGRRRGRRVRGVNLPARPTD